MNTFNQIIDYLSGKKALILGVIAITMPFLAQQGVVTQPIADFVLQLAGLLLGGARAYEIGMARTKN